MFTAFKVFLDDESNAVIASMDRADFRVKKRYGGIVRTVARRSMRKVNKRGEPSKPGEPPKERLGFIKRGRYGITFGIDPQTKSLVVGPERFPSRAAGNDGEPAVATLEHGGAVTIKEAQRKSGEWGIPSKWAELNGLPTRQRKVPLEARPYMAPARHKTNDKLLSLWRDAMHKV